VIETTGRPRAGRRRLDHLLRGERLAFRGGAVEARTMSRGCEVS
jgi:hypothetical protein